MRNKLEKAIAHYEATNERPTVYVNTGLYDFQDLSDGIFGDMNILEFIYKSLQPEKFGYSKVDAMEYYTQKLTLFNDEVRTIFDFLMTSSWCIRSCPRS